MRCANCRKPIVPESYFWYSPASRSNGHIHKNGLYFCNNLESTRAEPEEPLWLVLLITLLFMGALTCALVWWNP